MRCRRRKRLPREWLRDDRHDTELDHLAELELDWVSLLAIA